MDKKSDYFYMRLSSEKKEIVRELAADKNMSMTQYIWYLITKDREVNVRKNKRNA